MRCPVCGAAGFWPLPWLQRVRAQLGRVVAIVFAMTSAIVLQSDQLEKVAEPWRHYVVIAFLVSAVLLAIGFDNVKGASA